MLFVIFAIGLKWMMFKWDPIAGDASPLQVLADSQAQNWTLPPQFLYDPTIPGQPHIVVRGMALSPK